MDPVTHGALGAAVAQVTVGRRLGPRTWLYGAAGGMAADLDILICSSTDPMLAVEYHRHFTHSLAFVPIGGVLAALPWVLRRRYREDGAHWLIVAACVIGYATHALLDCCTAYGTMYLWPFSNARIAWSFISIIDPLYTIPLIVGVVLARRRGTVRPAMAGLVVAHLYMGLCGFQKWRATQARDRVLAARGHTAERTFMQAGLLTNRSWRSVYEFEGRIYADGIFTPWFSETLVVEGTSKARLQFDAAPAPVRENATTRRGLEVFDWFSSGWLVAEAAGEHAVTICDVRYGLPGWSMDALWCATLDPEAADPVMRHDGPGSRKRSETGTLLRGMFVPPEQAQPVP